MMKLIRDAADEIAHALNAEAVRLGALSASSEMTVSKVTTDVLQDRARDMRYLAFLVTQAQGGIQNALTAAAEADAKAMALEDQEPF